MLAMKQDRQCCAELTIGGSFRHYQKERQQTKGRAGQMEVSKQESMLQLTFRAHNITSAPPRNRKEPTVLAFPDHYHLTRPSAFFLVYHVETSNKTDYWDQ